MQISTKYMSGNVIFTWTPLNFSVYDVRLTRDRTLDSWTRVSDTQDTVRDVLLYDSITINVRTPGSPDDNKMTYNGLFLFTFVFIDFLTMSSKCVVSLERICKTMKINNVCL